jgi:hypothetical protein
MTDFINYPVHKTAKKAKLNMCESTREVVEEVVENLDELTEDEAVKKINESKKAVAKKTKDGVRVKQSLNG